MWTKFAWKCIHSISGLNANRLAMHGANQFLRTMDAENKRERLFKRNNKYEQ